MNYRCIDKKQILTARINELERHHLRLTLDRAYNSHNDIATRCFDNDIKEARRKLEILYRMYDEL